MGERGEGMREGTVDTGAEATAGGDVVSGAAAASGESACAFDGWRVRVRGGVCGELSADGVASRPAIMLSGDGPCRAGDIASANAGVG